MVEKVVFRPNARIISTIGSEIIKDKYAAIIELVKNAYDADASRVLVDIRKNEFGTVVSIEDDGCGMSKDVIFNKWFVPATPDKFYNGKSARGRVVQGRKGIGRFSVSILGEKLKLISFHDCKKIELDIDWNEFSDEKFLDEISVDVKEEATQIENGTKFIITGLSSEKFQWNEEECRSLIKELRKTMTPFVTKKVDDFKILVSIDPDIIVGFEDYEILPFPILDMCSYKVIGNVSNDRVKYQFINNHSGEIKDKDIDLINGLNTCGNINFEFRIFDRDKEILDAISKNEQFKVDVDRTGTTDIRQLLNEVCGVFIYRNGFRVRPYGDNGYDWLNLDKKRVQNPSLCIGTDQIFGIINIEDEEKSNLIDKSARDGLKEDDNYLNFKKIINSIIMNVEILRKNYRETVGLGRIKPKKDVHLVDRLHELTSNNTVISEINKIPISDEYKEKISSILENDFKEKEKIAENIQKEIALYQGQATLGKIMNLIMHEARKPLSWFINTANNMPLFINEYKKSGDEEYFNKLVNQANSNKQQAKILDALFKRLDPLASKTRQYPKEENLSLIVENSISIFRSELEEQDIILNIDMPEECKIRCYPADIIMAMANIIENSIYWLQFVNDREKQISIKVTDEENFIAIDIIDNGKGLDIDDIKTSVIFEPGISRKIGGGTGLGLPIAGEAVARNNGVLQAIENDIGARFRIEIFKEGVVNEG